MKHNGVKILAIGAAAAVALSACAPLEGADQPDSGGASEFAPEAFLGSPASVDEVTDGGTLIFAVSNDPGPLDPTISNALVARYIYSSMCESLYGVDAESNFVPVLASDLPEVSDDGLTYTIPLRDDARFSDGTSMTSEAVVKTLERNRDQPNSLRASEVAMISDVSAVDDNTVEIQLSEPYAALTMVLADRPGMILNPNTVDELGENFADAPSCVGPFKYDSSVPQTSVDLVADENYYNADDVFLDGISYRIMTDGNVRVANLESGDVHVTDQLPPNEVDRLMDAGDIELLRGLSLGYQGIRVNIGNANGVGEPVEILDTPLAQHAEVRQAFSMSINREEVVRSVYGNWAEPACGPVAPGTQFASPENQACPDYDPERAAEMIEDLGIETPVPVTLSTQNNARSSRAVQAIQSSLVDSPFEVSLDVRDFATLNTDNLTGDFETTYIGWGGRTDPDNVVSIFFHSEGSQNMSGYADDEMDSLIDKSVSVLDPEERTEIYNEITAKLQEDNPYIYVAREWNLTGQSSKITGVQMDPNAIVNVSFAGFAK